MGIANAIGRLAAGIIVLLVAMSRLVAAGETDLQALLGAEKRLRDSADFITEKGEPATLVLYVTKVEEPPSDRVDLDEPLSCGNQAEGIPLTGVYHVALVIDGAIVNGVTISPPGGGADGLMSLPMRNLPYYNYHDWGQGTEVEFDAAARHTEPTKLIRLADFNGDGHAWEFRLLSGICGHFSTLAAGYSAARRSVIVYPIFSGPFHSDWSDNFFAHPSVGNGTRIETLFRCGDHGNEDREVWQEYLYDAEREAWVLNRHRERDCDTAAGKTEQPADSSVAPVVLTVGSAEGSAGQRVAIEVSVDTGETIVQRIAHAVVVDPRISVAAIDGLDVDRIDNQWSQGQDGVGPIHCASELVASCEWAFQIRLDGNMVGQSILYSLRFTIPAGTAPGSYPLHNTNLEALDRTGRKLRVTGQDGAIVVRAPGANAAQQRASVE